MTYRAKLLAEALARHTERTAAKVNDLQHNSPFAVCLFLWATHQQQILWLDIPVGAAGYCQYGSYPGLWQADKGALQDTQQS